MNDLPLAGRRVVDCSALLPGPYCTMMLAELGAEVIKVERPVVGDFMMTVSPRLYQYLNAGKKLITLNLKQQQGVEILEKLVRNIDVFIEGFRPGVTRRLGIDFDSLKKVNPHIVYCSLSGYGQTGPYKDLPGHDINYQGLSGLLAVSGDPDSGPSPCSGFQVADIAGAMFALTTILAALNRSDKSVAVFLDVSIAESMAMWMMPRFMEYLDRGRPSKSDLMGRGPYGIFETSDGLYLTLGIVEDHFWTNLCRVLEFDDWLSDETLKGWTTRNRERRLILPRLQAAFKARPLDHWLTVLTRADVPVAPVCDFDDWTENPQFVDRAFFGASDAVDRPWPRFPLNFGHSFGAKGNETPTVGKDNEAVLGEIGLLAEEITRLRQERII